jgi:lipopolysaccharide transport protein LptA
MNTLLENPASKLRTASMVMLLPILPFLAIPCVQAKPGNSTSVNISANSIKLEPANRRILYSGKVRLQHKSLTITGSQAITKSQNSGSGEVTITGKPVVAKFVDSSGKVIQLKSQSLAYDSITRSLFASGNVELQSGDDRLSGQKMQYDMANDRFSIEGDQSQPRISAVVKISEKQTK